ncbi:transcriptional regulator [Bacteroidia bacterium]|nr:transcriptional regulator [Bacteroidia bacterium]
MENSRIEYKQMLTDNIEKEVVAFVNTDGGEIHIGVKNNGEILGIQNPDEVQLKLKDRLINNIRPSILGLFDIDLNVENNKPIVIIRLAAGIETPYYIKQKGRSEAGCFIRIGTSAQPMPEEMIKKLMAKRQPLVLINNPSRHQDLTFNQLKIFYEGRGIILNSQFAKTLDFLTPDGKYNQLAYLFADENNMSVRVAKWWGTDKIDLRENEEYGYCSIVKAMQKVIDKFDIENVTLAQKVGIGQRQEKKYVDSKSLREIIINAFVHNDYASGDTPIFEIFADRFEITTYGSLVEGLSKEEFFTGVSKPRSREIMRIFKDLEYVEHLGSGIPYIITKYGKEIVSFMPSVVRFNIPFYDIVKKNNGKSRVEKQESRVENEKSRVEKQESRVENEKSRVENKDKILILMQEQPKITAKEIAQKLNLSLKAIEKQIKTLKTNNTICRIGANKGGYWKVIDK